LKLCSEVIITQSDDYTRALGELDNSVSHRFSAHSAFRTSTGDSSNAQSRIPSDPGEYSSLSLTSGIPSDLTMMSCA